MAHLLGTSERPKRAPWREAPTAEALAFDRWRLSSALGGTPGETRIVRPGAFGLTFDTPRAGLFLGYDGKPHEDALLDGGIAVLPVCGPLEHHDGWWWTSYDAILREAEIAMTWPGVDALVLRIDSPGGVCAGMLSTHRALRTLAAKHGKPLVAFIDEMAASAAYGLASACGEIWMPPEAVAGSIGVILCVIDESAALDKMGIKVRYLVTGARKADLHPGAEVTDDALTVAQEKVDKLGARFFEAVGTARGMSPVAVRDLEAAVFMGENAVAAGLADGVADWPAFLGTLRGTLGATVAEARGTATPTRSTGDDMPTKMQLQKAKDDAEAAVRVAQAAVAVAKGDALAPALKALTDAIAVRDDAQAKVTHYKKMEEKTVESPDSKEKAADSEEEPAPDTAESADAKDSASDMRGEDDADEEAKGERALVKAYVAGTATLRGTAREHYGPRALLALCEKTFGVAGVQGVFGALAALPQSMTALKALEKSVKRLESESRAQRIDAVLRDPKNAAKVGGKEHREHLRAEGLKHGTAWLKGHLAVAPPAVRTPHEGHLEAKEGEDGRGQFLHAENDAQQKMLAQITADMTAEQKADFESAFKAQLAQGKTKVPGI